MGGCQNYGTFLGTLNNRCRTILRTQKGTKFLTTTHLVLGQPKYAKSRQGSLEAFRGGRGERRFGSGLRSGDVGVGGPLVWGGGADRV